MSTTVAAEISALSSIPKLAVDGTNYRIFKTRFLLAMMVKQLDNHFDGTSSKPAAPNIASTPDQINDFNDWTKKENDACNYLAQKIEDKTLDDLVNSPSVVDQWSKIEERFTTLSSHIVAAKQAEFDNMRCSRDWQYPRSLQGFASTRS